MQNLFGMMITCNSVKVVLPLCLGIWIFIKHEKIDWLKKINKIYFITNIYIMQRRDEQRKLKKYITYNIRL